MSPTPRDVLQTAIPFSELVANVAQYAPVPGLQPAAQAVTKLLKLLEGRYENDEAFKQLLKEACEFIAALESWTTKPEDKQDRLDTAVSTACKTLVQIAKKAKEQSERMAFVRFLFSKDDAKAIAEWQRQLKQAIDLFETGSHISLHEEIRLLKCAALATLMRDYIVPTASYDTSDKDNVIRCLDETRTAILHDFMAWVLNIEDPKQFIWLSAPAGGGKTAICRTFCGLVRKEGIAVAAYFLFKSSGRSSISRLLATLAYGIAEFDPRARATLQHIVTTNSHAFSKSLKTQFNEVMLPTLKAISQASTSAESRSVTPILILIDGLDECDDKPERTELLTLFLDALPRLHPAIKIIISSRQESDIHTTVSSFDQQHIRQDFIEPNNKDIRTILSTRFEKIRSSHPGRMHLPSKWPETSQYERLVEDSSGYPIFATVAMDYVAYGGGGPMAALKDVLQWTLVFDPNDSDPLAPLRALYRSILDTSRKPYILRKVLELAILYQDNRAAQLWPPEATNQLAADVLPGPTLSSTSVAGKWNALDVAQIDDAVLDISSLVSYQFLKPPSPSRRWPFGRWNLDPWKPNGVPYIRSISFFHKSFPDFLLSEAPCATFKFSVNLNKCAEETIIRCTSLLANKKFLTQQFYRSFVVPQPENYMKSERWDYHFTVRKAVYYLSHSEMHVMSPHVCNALLSYDFSDLNITFGFEITSSHMLAVQYQVLHNACIRFPDLISHFRKIGRRCLVEIPGFRDELRESEIAELEDYSISEL